MSATALRFKMPTENLSDKRMSKFKNKGKEPTVSWASILTIFILLTIQSLIFWYSHRISACRNCVTAELRSVLSFEKLKGLRVSWREEILHPWEMKNLSHQSLTRTMNRCWLIFFLLIRPHIIAGLLQLAVFIKVICTTIEEIVANVNTDCPEKQRNGCQAARSSYKC